MAEKRLIGAVLANFRKKSHIGDPIDLEIIFQVPSSLSRHDALFNSLYDYFLDDNFFDQKSGKIVSGTFFGDFFSADSPSSLSKNKQRKI